MKKILIIGSGGREQAICEAIKLSRQENYLIVFGNTVNYGIQKLVDKYILGDILDRESICKFAKEDNVDFAIIGPEAPIACGVSDSLIQAGISCISPTMNTGRIETSKSFTRNLLSKYHIPGNPVFKTFTSDSKMVDFIENNLGGNFVIKADGLKSGKGVFVMDDHFKSIEEGVAIAKSIIASEGKVVLEEKFIGQEFSLMFFTDGKTLARMPAVQDNKRAFEGDKGPNTGGMGSYSMPNHLLPFITQSDIEYAISVSKQVIESIALECGEVYKGILYGSFMKTRNGIRLIEYNARFGDPEAMNVLPLLKTDFIKICDSIINQTLHLVPVEFSNFATVCKYLVPEGYPDNPVKDMKVEIDFDQLTPDIKVYFSGVQSKNDGFYITGSRALAMVGVDRNLKKAEMLSEEGCWRVKGPLFYRKDIGKDDYILRKIKMMEDLMK